MSAPTFQLEITINRDGATPIHMQISEALASLILDGTLKPGTKLEDEVSMSTRLNISRATARQALHRLVNMGLVTRRRGVGTTVTAPQIHRPSRLSSLYADLTSEGFEASTSVLSYEHRLPHEKEMQLLQISPDTEIVRIHRLRKADAEPIALMTNLLPAESAPTAQELERRSLHDLLREAGIVPASAKQSIGARNASTWEAETLGERSLAAVLTATLTTYDAAGRIIEYGSHIYRASRYTIETTLFAS